MLNFPQLYPLTMKLDLRILAAGIADLAILGELDQVA